MNRKSIVLVSITVLGLLIGLILLVGLRNCNINTTETVSSDTNASVFSSLDSSDKPSQSTDNGSDYTEFYTSSSSETSGESSDITTSSSVDVTESSSPSKDGKVAPKNQTPTPKPTEKTTAAETGYTQSSWELPGI